MKKEFKKFTIGYTTGVFDLFHIGHLNILKKAKSKCDKLIVGVTTDELCFLLKGKKPIIPLRERVEIIKNIKYVDKVVIQSKIDELYDYSIYKFNLIFKVDDWKNTPKWKTLKNSFCKLGVKVHYIPYTKTTSSTLIKNIITCNYF